MLPTLALLTAAAGLAAWHYVRNGYLLQLGTYFNLCAVAYMGFGLIAARTGTVLGSESELERIGWMCVAAIIGFNVAYLVMNFRGARPSKRESDYLPSHTSLLVVVALGFSGEAAAILLSGPLDFLFADRADRFTVFRQRTALFYLANLMNVCLPIVLVRYLRFGLRSDRTLLGLLIAHQLLVALLTISRHDLAILLLVGGYFLERERGIRPLPMLCFLAAAFLFTLFYKPVLYDVILGREYHTAFDIGEYTNWIRHTLMMLRSPDVEMPHGGYALALKSLFVMRPTEDALSEWFMKEFFMERLLLYPGIGYGFSGVWQGYAANGLIGVAMHFAVFGALFGMLERSPTAMRHVLIVFAMVLVYRLFRSEAYNFVKTFAWYFVYPTLAIVVVDKFLHWSSRATSAAAGRRHPDTRDRTRQRQRDLLRRSPHASARN